MQEIPGNRSKAHGRLCYSSATPFPCKVLDVYSKSTKMIQPEYGAVREKCLCVTGLSSPGWDNLFGKQTLLCSKRKRKTNFVFVNIFTFRISFILVFHFIVILFSLFPVLPSTILGVFTVGWWDCGPAKFIVGDPPPDQWDLTQGTQSPLGKISHGSPEGTGPILIPVLVDNLFQSYSA